jgi:hypothetical protein
MGIEEASVMLAPAEEASGKEDSPQLDMAVEDQQ